MPIKNEIAHAVYGMLEALTVFNDRNELTAPIDRAAAQFDSLPAGARKSFRDSTRIQRIDPLTAQDRQIALVACLAVLKSAVAPSRSTTSVRGGCRTCRTRRAS
jgi:hypothetical protein